MPQFIKRHTPECAVPQGKGIACVVITLIKKDGVLHEITPEDYAYCLT